VTRTTLAALAAGAITFSLVGESFAQGRGFGMGGMSMGRGFGGNTMRTPGMGQRFPGGDGPRYPGGVYPRRPGVLVIPSVGPYGPYGPGRPGTVVEIDDDPPPRRITKQKPQKPKLQQAQQVGPRGGFDLPPAGEQRFVQDEVLLNVSPGTSNSALDSIARRHRLTRLELRDFAMTRRRLARLRINDGRAVASVIRSLQADARILGAQANFLYSLEQAAAGESRPPQYALDKLRLSEAHALARGESVRVAVVDTPIDAKHPDLAGAVAASFDATGASDKPHSHGTGIAGVIAAHGKLTGAAPAVSILAVHAFGSQSSKGSSMNVLKGLDWAGTSKAQIVNMSFAGAADSELQRMLVALRRNGIALIAAAGNAGPNARPLYPAAYPEVIAVTATDVDDKAFDRANRGTYIAVAAPGVAIIAAAPNDSYLMQSGTSFAAAQVSGVAALLIERNRNLDVASIRRILTTTARDLGAPGHDDQFGAGLVDALVAVEQATPKATDVSAQTPRTK
jgi:subtilisin family serine protease